ncbi:YopX family protein [Nitrobacter sp. TKz-YC02]|uniref:YopX family protein n=1 Tax=Nitrobacter sp. TKz-YC02 TaxID=3398704 RepID=UPI003CF04E13
MNRPIKYRAWANGKMREVRAISFTETGEVHRILDSEGVQRVPEALLQFTGFTDKYDKEIWVGSILMYPDTESHYVHNGIGEQKVAETGVNSFFLVEMRDGEFGMEVKGGEVTYGDLGWISLRAFFQDYVEQKECEVIGDIYQNPELLK